MKNVVFLFVFCLILFSLISVPISAQTEGAFDASKSVFDTNRQDASNAPQWVAEPWRRIRKKPRRSAARWL